MMIQRHNKRRRGFTLLEVLLVVGILVALAGLVVTQLIGTQEGAEIDNAKIQVGSFEQTFQTYRTHMGSFPATEQGFSALINDPDQTGKWRGPYIKETDLNDPWGNPYNYQYPSRKQNSRLPDIWSNGPDGVSGTVDDITNLN